MLRNSTIIILVLFIANLNGYGQETDSRAKVEAMIRTNVEQLAKGWSMKSVAEFAKPFAEDSDFVVGNGMHIKSRAANAEAHQRIFDTIYKYSSIAPVVKQIRFLRPFIVIVHGNSNLTFKVNGEEKKVSGFVTLVMTKEKGKWSIAAFQNTEIQPQGGK